MKNKIKLFGVMALVTIIGFSMTACDDGGDDGSIEINGWKFRAWGDKNDGGTSTIAMSRDSNKLTITGNLTKNAGTAPNTYGYSSLGITPNANLLSQLKNSTGFFFDIIGDGNTYYLVLVTSDVKDYGYYRAQFTTENGVQKQISIPFSSLAQPSWATPVQAHTNNITSLQIQTHTDITNQGQYNFSLVVE